MFTSPHAAWLILPGVYVASLILGRALNLRQTVRLGAGYHFGAVACGLLLSHALAGLFRPETIAAAIASFGVTAEPDIAARASRHLLHATFALAAFSWTSVALTLLRRYYWELWFERRHREPAPKFLRQIVSGATYVAVALILLQTVFDVQIPGLLTGSGILVAVLGFAMQDLLGNVISGASLNLGKPFRIGDWLLIDGRQARVVEVNWRSTRLVTNDLHQLDYPNNVLARLPVVNFGPQGSVHAMRITLGVAYETPPNTAKAALLRATRHTAGVLAEPPASVQLRDFGDNAVLYDVKFYIEDQAKYPEIADGIRTHIWYELHREGIRVPFPVRTLHIERGRTATADEKRDRVAQLLAAQPLFSHLREREIRDLASGARTVLYGAGESVVKTGEAGDSLFLVVSGTLRVEVTRDGVRRTVATLRDAECFGEMSLLTGAPRAADVVAESDCELVEVAKVAFSAVLAGRPEIAPLLCEMLARRRAEADAAYAALAPAERDAESRRRGAEILANITAFFRL